jgi:hypothetical protein
MFIIIFDFSISVLNWKHASHVHLYGEQVLLPFLDAKNPSMAEIINRQPRFLRHKLLLTIKD